MNRFRILTAVGLTFLYGPFSFAIMPAPQVPGGIQSVCGWSMGQPAANFFSNPFGALGNIFGSSAEKNYVPDVSIPHCSKEVDQQVDEAFSRGQRACLAGYGIGVAPVTAAPKVEDPLAGLTPDICATILGQGPLGCANGSPPDVPSPVLAACNNIAAVNHAADKQDPDPSPRSDDPAQMIVDALKDYSSDGQGHDFNGRLDRIWRSQSDPACQGSLSGFLLRIRGQIVAELREAAKHAPPSPPVPPVASMPAPPQQQPAPATVQPLAGIDREPLDPLSPRPAPQSPMDQTTPTRNDHQHSQPDPHPQPVHDSQRDTEPHSVRHPRHRLVTHRRPPHTTTPGGDVTWGATDSDGSRYFLIASKDKKTFYVGKAKHFDPSKAIRPSDVEVFKVSRATAQEINDGALPLDEHVNDMINDHDRLQSSREKAVLTRMLNRSLVKNRKKSKRIDALDLMPSFTSNDSSKPRNFVVTDHNGNVYVGVVIPMGNGNPPKILAKKMDISGDQHTGTMLRKNPKLLNHLIKLSAERLSQEVGEEIRGLVLVDSVDL